jgi:hypothetical protein
MSQYNGTDTSVAFNDVEQLLGSVRERIPNLENLLRDYRERRRSYELMRDRESVPRIPSPSTTSESSPYRI